MLLASRPRLAGLLLAFAVALVPARGQAFSTGIPSTVFNAAGIGCNACHTGGDAPGVVLSGPTVVDPGDTVIYTLTVFGSSGQNLAGLNVSSATGTLSTGGPFSARTKTTSGVGGRAEITHSLPKMGDFANIIEFSFRWTAPANFAGTATLRGWGNAVNGNGITLGDAATGATLDIDSSAPPASPTPTPTPGPDYCIPATPAEPPLVGDLAQQRCQRAIAKAGALYVRKGLKAAQSCLKSLQAGSASAEPIGLCAGTAAAGAGLPPQDGRTASALAKAAAKVRSVLRAKCPDEAVAGLDSCASTEAGLEQCLLASHHQTLVDVLTSQYGALAPTDNGDLQKCQRAIGAGSAGYLVNFLKSSQKCLDERNAANNPASGAALCIGTWVGSSFIAPSDAEVAAKVDKAAATLDKKVSGACTDLLLSQLSACAGNTADAIECLTCAQRSAVLGLLASEYAGQ